MDLWGRHVGESGASSNSRLARSPDVAGNVVETEAVGVEGVDRAAPSRRPWRRQWGKCLARCSDRPGLGVSSSPHAYLALSEAALVVYSASIRLPREAAASPIRCRRTASFQEHGPVDGRFVRSDATRPSGCLPVGAVHLPPPGCLCHRAGEREAGGRSPANTKDQPYRLGVDWGAGGVHELVSLVGGGVPVDLVAHSVTRRIGPSPSAGNPSGLSPPIRNSTGCRWTSERRREWAGLSRAGGRGNRVVAAAPVGGTADGVYDRRALVHWGCLGPKVAASCCCAGQRAPLVPGRGGRSLRRSPW